MREVVLRPTRATDLPFVLRTEVDPGNTPFIGHWTEARHREVMADPDWSHEIVEDPGGEPVGYLIAHGRAASESGVYIQRIALARRDAGYGRAALTAFIDRVLAAGGRRIWLRVYETNTRGRYLYTSLGFVEEQRVAASRPGDPVRIAMAFEPA